MTAIAISASGGTRNSNDTASWDGGVLPTSADDVVARSDGTSGSLTINAAFACRSMDLDNGTATYSATLTHNAGITVTVGAAALPATSVAVRFSAAMTYTRGSNSTSAWSFVATTTGGKITSAGKQWGTTTFNGVGGGWILQDAWVTAGNNNNTTITAGNFNGNAKAITANILSNNSNVRTVNLDGCAITVPGSSGTLVNFTTTTNLTFSAVGSVVTWSAVSGGVSWTFASGGLTWGEIVAPVAATSTFVITGAGTAKLTVSGIGTLTMPASTIFTLASGSTLSGTPNVRTAIQSSSGGTAATVSCASAVTINHTTLKDITAQGGGVFSAYDSYNVSGVTGVTHVTPNKRMLVGVA